MNTSTPPVVPGLPIIGCALQTVFSDPREFLLKQMRDLGPVFHLKAFHINYVVMAGPDANQFVNVEFFIYNEISKEPNFISGPIL